MIPGKWRPLGWRSNIITMISLFSAAVAMSITSIGWRSAAIAGAVVLSHILGYYEGRQRQEEFDNYFNERFGREWGNRSGGAR